MVSMAFIGDRRQGEEQEGSEERKQKNTHASTSRRIRVRGF